MRLDYEYLRSIVEAGIRSGMIKKPDPPKRKVPVYSTITCECGRDFEKKSARVLRCDECRDKKIKCEICGVDMTIRYRKHKKDGYVKTCVKKECVQAYMSLSKKRRYAGKREKNK